MVSLCDYTMYTVKLYRNDDVSGQLQPPRLFKEDNFLFKFSSCYGTKSLDIVYNAFKNLLTNYKNYSFVVSVVGEVSETFYNENEEMNLPTFIGKMDCSLQINNM